MVLNATFNNILAISWQSVLLVEETEYPGKTTDLPQVTGNLYPIKLYRAHLSRVGLEHTTLVMIVTDCICSCKSNYHIRSRQQQPLFLYRNYDRAI